MSRQLDILNLPRKVYATDDLWLPSHRPSHQVDYLSYNWQEEDLWRSWRNITPNKHTVRDGIRLENASWRVWWKQKNNLLTIAPEHVNWQKTSDVTWLYGPLLTKDYQSGTVQLHAPTSDQSTDGGRASRSTDLKPILASHRNTARPFLSAVSSPVSSLHRTNNRNDLLLGPRAPRTWDDWPDVRNERKRKTITFNPFIETTSWPGDDVTDDEALFEDNPRILELETSLAEKDEKIASMTESHAAEVKNFTEKLAAQEKLTEDMRVQHVKEVSHLHEQITNLTKELVETKAGVHKHTEKLSKAEAQHALSVETLQYVLDRVSGSLAQLRVNPVFEVRKEPETVLTIHGEYPR
ncbi:hypothetical protein EIP91_007429 [Steccherinum ochraceum]|uniref:Nitrogen regulatory protein areA GATA-like domain-containing protein n=1 Tax=Steccherinum ochraceum TaxID=92696 RepID=A0A4R0RUR0_9APHY|nr:hypothetical protein EIP91_007429 [Steccherinum ochraceum]